MGKQIKTATKRMIRDAFITDEDITFCSLNCPHEFKTDFFSVLVYCVRGWHYRNQSWATIKAAQQEFWKMTYEDLKKYERSQR